MKWPILLLLFELLYANSRCQTTFNIRVRYGFPACVLTNIYPADSCYFAMGLVADTIFPHKAAALFLKLDLGGNMTLLKTTKHPEKTYEPWFKSPDRLPNGDFLVAGNTRDSTIKSLIIKYNAEGDTLFTKEYFSPYYPTSNTMTPLAGMVILPNANIVLYNSVGTSDDIFANNPNSYLISTDSLGNILWDKIYGTSKFERPESILATPDGKVICGGIRTNATTNVMNYTFQCHIFQVDSLGNMDWEWLSPISAGLRDAANDMVLIDDGSLIVVSGVGHEIQHASVNEVLFDRHIFKLSPEREIEWELTFLDSEPTYWSRTTNLVKLSDGSGYVMAGLSFNPDWLPPYTEPVKGWLAKISVDGDSVWTRSYSYPYSSPLLHQLYDMKETPDGGLILCGQAHDLADTALYFPQQGWLLKLDEHGCLVPGCHLSDATTEVGPVTEIKLSIYPNPTSDYLNFYVHAPNPASLATFCIIDSTGRLVREFKADNLSSTFIVPVWEWPRGVYWLQYCVEGEAVISEQFQILK